MLRSIALVTALVGLSAGDYKANLWMDSVMNEMRSEVSKVGLNPMRMAPFHFQIKSNGYYNRDLKASFTQGTLNGYSHLVRDGNCYYEYMSLHGNTKLGCYISFNGVWSEMRGVVKSDESYGATSDITTISRMTPNILAHVEFQCRSGSVPILTKFRIGVPTLEKPEIRGTLMLNQDSLKLFNDALNQNIASQIKSRASYYYEKALRNAIAVKRFP